MRRRPWGVLVAGLVLLASCGGSAAPTPTSSPGTRIVPHGSSAVAMVAIADLARRLGIGATQVSIAKVEVVDWPDTSLGCPEPGTVYAQVVTPGYRILLLAQGQTYEYHTDRTSRAVYCPPAPTAQP